MIFLLYGPDTFRSRQKLQEIIIQYQKKHKQGFNFRRFDADSFDFGDFQDEVRQASMFREKKLIILENAFTKDGFKERFFKEKEKFLESDDVIVFFEIAKILAKDPLLKFLSKKAKIQQFDFLDGVKLKNWIKSMFENYNASISERVPDKLITFVGNDLWRMDQEIKKLVNFKAGKMIDEQDVVLLVRPKIESDIFKTIDAIADKRKGLALNLLHKHLAVDNAPLYLLAMINYQFRNLLVVKDLMEKNNPFQVAAAKSGLNPFVARKSWYLAQKFTFPELKKIYRKIFQIDLDIKTGRADAATALDLFVSEI